MKKQFVALLLAIALVLVGSAANAQQYSVLPPSTTINVVPVDSTTGTPVSVTQTVSVQSRLPARNYHAQCPLHGRCSTVGNDGSVYFPVVSSTNTYAICKITNGAPTILTPPTTDTPIGQLCTDKNGKIWGTYYASFNYFSYDPATNTFTNYSTYGAGNQSVGGICYNPQNDVIYILADYGGALTKINLNGNVLGVINTPYLVNANPELLTGPDGRVYGAGGSSGVLVAVDTSNNVSNYPISGLGTKTSIESDGSNLWILDPLNSRVIKVTTDGTVLATVDYQYVLPAAPSLDYGSIAYMNGRIVVSEGGINQLVSIDPTTIARQTYELPSVKVLTGLVAGTDGFLYGYSFWGAGGDGEIKRLSFGGVLSTVNNDIVSSATPIQYAATTNGNGIALKLNNASTAVLSISGTFNATVNFEASFDNSTWVPIAGFNRATGATGTSTSSAGDWSLPVHGYQYLRARISNFSSGSVTVNAYTTTAAIIPIITNITEVGGTSNPLPVEPVQKRATYSAGITFPNATNATDFFTIRGSDTKIVKVWTVYVVYSNSVNSSNTQVINLIRRYTDDMGAATSVPYAKRDTTSDNPTAVLHYYTTNPSGLGISQGTIATLRHSNLNSTAAPGTQPPYIFDASKTGAPIVLRGTSEILALNGNGSMVASGNLTVTVEWTEE
jgi:hypothetical protein